VTTTDPSFADTGLDWSDDGQPRSRLYGDVYFSAEDGLAEARAVFLAGCGLPQAWADRRRFVVGELGFGTGLNILALIELWARTRPPGGQLGIFSIEAHPITADEARRALAHWPELAGLTRRLTDQWPGRALGVHRSAFPDLGVTLDVAVGEAGDALAGWSGQADAWFLDGFAPALNPAMWRDDLLRLVGARSAPGAVAATFTVAGQVRRGLAAAGFAVEKLPGFGRKRERLAARLPGAPPTERPGSRVAIVGAGIAGAAAARAVRALGGEAVVFEAVGPGAGASGNPAALVTPRLDAGLGPPARLFAEAFRRAVALYEAEPGAIVARGVLQRPGQPRDPARFAAIAGSGLFEPGSMTVEALGGLSQRAALVVEPAAVLATWAPDVHLGRVASLRREGAVWALVDPGGHDLAQADAVILAAGPASADLLEGLTLRPVRGQLTWAALADPPPASAGGGYVAPTRDGVMFGATHDRDDSGTDPRPADDLRNLAALAAVMPELAARLADASLMSRASIRATSPDRLPIAGPVGDGHPELFVLTGLGSRGFSLAPLLAEHLAALALGAPSPLARDLAELVDPGRFARRAARRGSQTGGQGLDWRGSGDAPLSRT
jgi:tRNA 5-methylaminomethyl-2-thiouridine biosynthesis bifunctional protein